MKHKHVRTKYALIYNDVDILNNVKSVIQSKINQPPFSKFGIEAFFEYQTIIDFTHYRDLYGYSINNAHQFVKNADMNTTSIRIISPIKLDISNN